MRIGRLMPLFVMGLLVAAAPLQAQEHPLKIATVNPFKILAQMDEFKDLKAKYDSETSQLNAEMKKKTDALQTLNAQRHEIKPDHPQYEELSNKIDAGAAELDAWKRTIQLQTERQQKKNVRDLFVKIEQATGAIAEQEKIDLVITDSRRELPNIEAMNYEMLLGNLSQRNVLFAAKGLDISEKVLARLDADYARSKGPGQPGGQPRPQNQPVH